MAFLFIFILLILFIYVFLLMPGLGRGREFSPFEKVYIAHRGFFNNETEKPENSLAAFASAVENGYGIELDVQMTADGKLVVFHDDSLLRMCGVDKLLEDCSFEELQTYFLKNSDEKIPLFTDVLKVIDCKVPLIVEIKNTKKYQEVCEKTASVLDSYKGIYCIESFNPFMVAYFKKNRPAVIRGQLSTDYFKDEPQMKFTSKFVLTNLLLNFYARPDFIAYNHNHKNQFSYKILRKIYPIKNVAWTIKNQDELDSARDVFTCLIFDSFTPNR